MNKSSCRSRQALKFLLAIACVMLISMPLEAQTSSGSIVGTVKDSTGAVIPGVSVTLINPATADKRTAVTEGNGSYRFLNIAPAKYRLDFELKGFKHLTRDPVTVQVESSVLIDAVLEIGNISETVEVTAQTPLLDTQTATVGSVVEAKTVLEMPLNGRNVMNLIALVPGVVAQGSTAGSIINNQSVGHTNNKGLNNYQMGGGIAGYGSAYLDGAPTIGLGNNAVVLIATQDAVQEFRVATNNVSPEYGRFGGGVVNMASKSGTNQFHGSAYEYFRNRVLNANTFFGNALGQPKPAFNQNQFGANLGGPVRKDKTFFFFSWEQAHAKVGTTYQTFVPTALEKAGDFSASLGASTGVINPCTGDPILAGQIFDPLTTTKVGGKNCRMPFAGNKIPTNRINSVSDIIANKLKWWPDPNTSSTGGNFVSTPNPGGTQQQFNVRADENISERQRFFTRFTYWEVHDIPVNRMGNQTGGAGSNLVTHQAVLGDTYSFSPTLIMEGRLSFTRNYYDDQPPSKGWDMSQLGPAFASLNSLVTFREQPTVDATPIYRFMGMNVTSEYYKNTWALSLNLTKISGRHTLKFGGEARLMDYTYNETTQPAGNFKFDRNFTNVDGSATSTGNPFASYMLGYPFSGAITTLRLPAMYSRYQGYYFGDTYQMTNKLTLNYGIRWELPGGYAEKHDYSTVLKPDMVDPLSSSTGLPLKGQLVFVNSKDWSNRTAQKVPYHIFVPRVGFAYRVMKSTVLRGGYGISYLPQDLKAGAGAFGSPINSATTTMNTSVNNENLIPLNTLSSPFPAGGVTGTIQQEILQPAGRSTAYLANLEGLTISGSIPEQPYAYVQQWNFNIQHELLTGLMFEIGYVGSKGTHLPAGSVQLNQLDSKYYSLGSALLTQVANPMAGKLSTASAYNKSTIAQGQLYRPYPQFSAVTDTGALVGDSNYHSLQARVEKRFGDAGIVSGNYTWAKFIGNVDTPNTFLEQASLIGAYQDYNNLAGERSLLSNDIPHRFVASYVLELPVGKGKRFAAGAPVLVGGLISGWSVNGIVTLQSGYPIAISAQRNTLANSFGAGTIRPNRVAGCDPVISGSAQSRLNGWFNTACFTQPGAYSFGNESRTDPVLRTHGVNNVDFTVSKSTKITEQVKLQFKTEFFNLFNRVQFKVYNTILGASGNLFGKVTDQANQPRLIQFSLRLVF